MRLTDFDAILFDMDGTLYREGIMIPGVADALARLRQRAMRIVCVTNNSANTAAELARRLHGMGIDVAADSIYTACHAMVEWIEKFAVTKSLGRRPRVFNFAGRALPLDLDGRAELVEDSAGPCDIVALGTHMRENAVGFDFERSLVALNLLWRGADMVVGCRDRVFPIQGGQVEFGSGSWGELFAFACNLDSNRVHYAGKPNPEFFRAAAKRLGVQPHRCLIVGDNLESDIQGGLDAGMATALVLTGITDRAAADVSATKPHAVFDNLTQLVAAIG